MHVLSSQLKEDADFAFQDSWSEEKANDIIDGYADHKVVGSLHFNGLLRRRGSKCHLTGSFRVKTQALCYRCLEPIIYDLNEDIELELLPVSRANTHDGYEIGSDELDIIYFENNKIDLDSIFAESLVLELPTHHLCQQACKGLCSHCGKNLNQKQCHCESSLNI